MKTLAVATVAVVVGAIAVNVVAFMTGNALKAKLAEQIDSNSELNMTS